MDNLYAVALPILQNALKAVTALWQPDSYLYWPYALSTLLLALGIDKTSFFRKDLWWNSSTRQDYQLYLLNFILLPPLFGWMAFHEGLVVDFFNTHVAAMSVQKVATLESANSWPLRLLFTACIFVMYDLGRFVGHWLLHHVPALWELHKVHHSATAMTPFTAYRVHPVEPVLMNIVCIAMTGFTLWVFNRYFGAGIPVYIFLGTHAGLALLNFFDNLRHSAVWLHYGPVLNRWIISPAHHQLHHSMEDRHMGCNLGAALAIWDRLNGTLVVPAKAKEDFRLGLPPEDVRHLGNLRSLYLQPLWAAARCLLPRMKAQSA